MARPEININSVRTQPTFYCWRYGGSTSPWYSNGDQLYSVFLRYKPQAISTPVVPPDTVRKQTVWYTNVVSCRYGDLQTMADYGSIQYFYTGSSAYSVGVPYDQTFSSEYWERAINGALEKLKDQSVNLSVAYKERGKTADLVNKHVTRISIGLQKFRQLRGGSLYRKVLDVGRGLTPRVRDYPSEYLEMAYGWTPLLQDIEGSCEALSKREQRGNKPYFIRVSKKFERSESFLRDATDFMAYQGWAFAPIVGVEDKREGAKATFYYALDNPVLVAFSSLGLTNPASVAWEVLPFSFVADWAVPVGGWLNNLDADFGYSYLGGSVSRWMERRFAGRYTKFPPSHSLSGGSPGNCTYRRFKMDRSVFNTAPWPVPPSFRYPFTSERRVASALALVETITGRNGRLPSGVRL